MFGAPAPKTDILAPPLHLGGGADFGMEGGGPNMGYKPMLGMI